MSSTLKIVIEHEKEFTVMDWFAFKELLPFWYEGFLVKLMIEILKHRVTY